MGLLLWAMAQTILIIRYLIGFPSMRDLPAAYFINWVQFSNNPLICCMKN